MRASIWFALGVVEAFGLGSEDEGMGRVSTLGKPTTRRYSSEEKAQAVRLVRQLRRELGMSQGTVKRVADQLGYGVESVRTWVRQADIDGGDVAGMSTADREKMKTLEQENKELRRANEILKSASAFFAAELDRPQK
jgi:transposase